MPQLVRLHKPPGRLNEPTWEIAHLFPTQGNWSEEDYLELNGNYLIEFSHGRLEVLPMPTTSHQMVVLYLYGLIKAFTALRDLGTVAVAPLRVRLWPGKFREPDIIFMLKKHAKRIGEEFWLRADLVIEVVSGKKKDENWRRDLVIKRLEYERARIPEYWIVDPQNEQITVLRLGANGYVVHGTFAKGTVASSHLLQGFNVDVNEVFSESVQFPAGKSARKRKRRPRS